MNPAKLGLKRGEEVEVRSLSAIRATLDARGTLGGIPFMPEMERFAGRRARVWRRADRVCVEGAPTMRRLRDVVVLEGLRCDGVAHGGCQRACLLLWNEAWLRRPKPGGSARAASAPASPQRSVGPPPPAAGTRLFCQSTALLDASTPLPSWRLDSLLKELVTGNRTPWELARCLVDTAGYLVKDKARRRRLRAQTSRTPDGRLGLKAGEWVEVKGLAEIEATLNAQRKNRGLAFLPCMARSCGRRFQVAGRLDRMVMEGSGELRDLSDTVILDGLYCTGGLRACPRASPFYWRESWLRRAPPGPD